MIKEYVVTQQYEANHSILWGKESYTKGLTIKLLWELQ